MTHSLSTRRQQCSRFLIQGTVFPCKFGVELATPISTGKIQISIYLSFMALHIPLLTHEWWLMIAIIMHWMIMGNLLCKGFVMHVGKKKKKKVHTYKIICNIYFIPRFDMLHMLSLKALSAIGTLISSFDKEHNDMQELKVKLHWIVLQRSKSFADTSKQPFW